MTSRRVLFIGGTGIISTSSGRRALEQGWDLTLLNRGSSTTRPVPDGAEVVVADIRDPACVKAALGDREFDAVVDFVAFTPEHVKADVEVFTGRTGQYVFISSASAYQTPPARLPILESSPLRNPAWEYSQNKIAAEQVLVDAYRSTGFPATIVRPSHTYDETALPTTGGWTDIDRMRRGVPVVVHGDGSSIWVLTHSRDFAVAFVGLLGHPQAVGDSFHITSDQLQTWDQIYRELGAAAGVEPNLVHVTSDDIALLHPPFGPGLLGDKTHSVIFDNSKVKALVPEYVATTPFSVGAREIIAWYDADASRRTVDADTDAVFERILAATKQG
jgi:nucleoside-diphosphate-sugar epimerase